MEGHECILMGLVFAIITGIAWFVTKEPMNATLIAIGQIIWGLIQMALLDKKKATSPN